MSIEEIRVLVSKARIEPAIKETLNLTASTDLKNNAILVSNSYRTFRNKKISGLFNSSEERQEFALISSRLLELLDEYEILQIKDIKNSLDNLKTELQTKNDVLEVRETIEELDTLNKEVEEIEFAGKKEDIKPNTIEKIRNFLSRFEDPDSKESKAVRVIKNGVEICQNLAEKYNSIAEWFALPQVPKLFLK